MDRDESTGAKLAAPLLIYGRNPVLEALRAGRRIKRVLIAQSAHGRPLGVLVAEAEARGVLVEFVPRQRLDTITAHHQGVAAEAEAFAYTHLNDLSERLRSSPTTPMVVAVDGLQDPQNLGTLVRTAAAVGASGVVLPERRTVGVTPSVIKASAGAIEHVPVVQVTNLVRALEGLKQMGLWVTGLAADAAQLPWEVDLTLPTVLLVGGEGSGLSRLARERCDFLVRVPMAGRVESLNAAVAGSMVLYEALRQRSHARSD